MIDFQQLWDNFPTERYPCADDSGAPNFENQCAIRMGTCLANAGFDLSRFPGEDCWYHETPNHVLRAEELANWLASEALEFGEVELRSNVDASAYYGRRGIIFCRNFWGPNRQGDHIDLWNRNYMLNGRASYISHSSDVWFWDLRSNIA